jgi:hypothetical protein
MELTNFLAKTRRAGNTSLEVTIPLNVCEYEGLEEGDLIKVIIKKVKKEE